MLEELLRHGERLDIFALASLGWVEETKTLLKKDPALVKTRLTFGATPLHMAAENGQHQMAGHLISQGAEMDLLCAAELGWVDEVVAQLNATPASVNHKSGSFGFTALHSASTKGRSDVARLLLTKGAEVNARDRMYEKTPLAEAIYFGREDMARLLCYHGGTVR